MKYTREQLRSKAKLAMVAKEQGDPRWLQLILTLSGRLNSSPVAIEARIRRLAH
jgi:hypothetical protein